MQSRLGALSRSSTRALFFARNFTLKASAPDSTDPILLELSGPKAVITLNNAKLANAIDVDLQHSLIEHMEALSESKDVRAIIITGKGKYFCSGMNLGDKGESLAGNNDEQCSRHFFELSRKTGNLSLASSMDLAMEMSVASVNFDMKAQFFPFSRGNGLAMACDIRIAAHPDVTFTMSETRLGVVPAMISKYMVREWGVARAREAMILARPVHCKELLPTGGVHHITSDLNEAMQLADSLVAKLVGNAPNAINNAKRLCKSASEQIEETHDGLAREAFLEFAAPSAEAQFGIQAFRKKEKADWSKLNA